MKSFIPVLCLFLSLTVQSQTILSIGEWQALLPFNQGLSVTQSPSTVYYSSALGIVGFDKEERSHFTWTKVDGLSSSEPAKVMYHEKTGSLIAVYSSGVIDVISEDGVKTMKDIANFDNIPIDKKANNLYDQGDDAMLLSANYGVSSIDVENQKVLWTSFTFNNPIYATLEKDGFYYAATGEGLFRIRTNGLVENFSAWERVGLSNGLPETGFEAMTIFDGSIYLGHQGDLYKETDTAWTLVHSEGGFEIRDLYGERNLLLASYFCTSGCNSKVVSFDKNFELKSSGGGCANRIVQAIEDQYGAIWYADMWDGFRVSSSRTSGCSPLTINGPYRERANDIAVGQDEIVVASGGTINGFQYSFRNDGFFTLDASGEWTNHNLFNTQELKDRDLKNFHRVAVHPGNGDRYLATYWGGVVVYKQDGSYIFWDESNSTLREKDPGDARERCTDVTFDDENNLWVTTFLAPENVLSVLTNDGEWKGFDPPNIGKGLNQVAIDNNGYKWVTLLGDAARGVYVFDEGDMEDPNDDRGYVFNRTNSELPSNNAICITVDLEGDVWVGTDQGAVVFECGTDIFEGGCRGNRRKVEQDSIIGLLLETEEVLCIAVDGANRKWFGTRSGIYVQSPSGEDQVFTLNEENSPLVDNVISEIEIDPKTGTAYIATDKGIMAYRSDATQGGQSHANEVVAFPNPVRPGYDGPIAIKGLPQNAEVRITDISGFLIYETEANGGQAIWDGRDYNGRKAESGIYLVFSTSDAGDFEDPEALVSKILIMN